MLSSATLLLSRPAGTHTPVPRERAQRIAQTLKALGFRVLSIGRFGISVEAEEVVYEAVLDVPMTNHAQAVFPVEHPHPLLEGELLRVHRPVPLGYDNR